MRHITKTNGDIGVACVIADLAKQGVDVAVPLSEHLPFDLIAVIEGKFLARVQVKYRSLENGTVRVNLANCASNANGFYHKPVDTSLIDVYAIYCPDVDEVYYVPMGEVAHTTGFNVRVHEAKSNQRVGVRPCANFRDARRAITGLKEAV